MSKKKETPAAFQLFHMEVGRAGIELPEDFRPTKNYQYEVELESLIDGINRSLKVICEVRVFSSESSARLAYIRAIFTFGIADFEKVIKQGLKGSVQVPQSLQLSVNAIAISTTRGLLWSMVKGTSLSDVILPIIDHEQFEINQLDV